MGNDTTAIANQKLETGLGRQSQWMRVTFAGLTAGEPPRATFHACLTLRNGTTKHVSQAVRVTDDAILLRLIKLPVGTEIRVCTETDWNAPDIPVTLKDFCCLSPESPNSPRQITTP